ALKDRRTPREPKRATRAEARGRAPATVGGRAVDPGQCPLPSLPAGRLSSSGGRDWSDGAANSAEKAYVYAVRYESPLRRLRVSGWVGDLRGPVLLAGLTAL